MKRNVISTLVLMIAALANGLFAQYAELEIAEIKRPFDVEEGGEGFKPKCVINNNASYTVNAKVTCRIKDLETFEFVYEDVLANFPCYGGNTSAEFREFVPEGGKDYNAWFRVEAPQTGDTKDKNFTTEGYDVTPYEMIVPDYGMYPPFSPEALFAEGLGVETPDVILHCTIEDMMDSSTLAVIYEDSLGSHTFTPHDTFDAVFASVVDVPYAYLITFWVTDAQGNNISHPPLQEIIFSNEVAEDPVSNSSIQVLPISSDLWTITFALGSETTYELSVYDVAGKSVASLSSGILGNGEHSVTWDTRNLTQGVYFLRLSTSCFKTVRKVTVIH
ncbi:T9SS type A sorting domain-containing protein [candidate division WOR-3 bacterium]|nr:T9SS type A sorting domain-containing protein [candidate division WOR-3 bacterium]